MSLCKCGCGKEVNIEKIYLRGHNKRGMPSTFLGRHHTEESKRRLSEINKGKPSPMIGRHHTEESKSKLSQIAKNQWADARAKGIAIGFMGYRLNEENKAKLRECHLGKHLSEETKAKLSKTHKGEANYWYGKHHTEESKRKIGSFFRGKHLSEEHKANISRGNKGRKLTDIQIERIKKMRMGQHHSYETKAKLSKITKMQRLGMKGMSNSIDRTGTKHSKETRIKMSIKSRRRWANPENKIKVSGENSHLWLGGKSFEPYTKEFNVQLKGLIRMRDAYTCQLCGIPECENMKTLTVHHIDYDKQNSLPINLISLCNNCNLKVNRNRGYWTNYFRELLNKRQINPKELKVSNTYVVLKSFVGTGV